MPSSSAKIRIFKSYGAWVWELKVRGKVVVTSDGEFANKSNARRNAESVRKQFAGATIIIDE